jgi:putative hydrolase of the HAD superfamily
MGNYMHTNDSHLPRYSAIIFDLYGTLIPWCKNGFKTMLLEIADVLGANGDEFVRVIYKISNESMTGQFGTIADEIEYICRLLETDTDADSIEQAAQLWSDFHWQGYEKPYPGALSSLQQLRKIGMRTGVITNCGAEAPELWAHSQLAPLFDTVLFSVTEGIQKPVNDSM